MAFFTRHSCVEISVSLADVGSLAVRAGENEVEYLIIKSDLIQNTIFFMSQINKI